jgi:hypothetical protein
MKSLTFTRNQQVDKLHAWFPNTGVSKTVLCANMFSHIFCVCTLFSVYMVSLVMSLHEALNFVCKTKMGMQNAYLSNNSCTEQSPSSETDSHLASQEIP